MDFNKITKLVYSHMLNIEQDFAPMFKKTLNYVLKQNNYKAAENKQIEKLNAVYTTQFEEVEGVKLPKSLTILLKKDEQKTTLYLNLLDAANYIKNDVSVGKIVSDNYYKHLHNFKEMHHMYLGQIDTLTKTNSQTIDFNYTMQLIGDTTYHHNLVIKKMIDITKQNPAERYKKEEKSSLNVWGDLITARNQYQKDINKKQATPSYEAVSQ